MITLRRSLIGAILALFGLSSLALAQSTVATTTTAAAVTATGKTVTLNSVTGLSVGSGLFMDREAMSVTTINTTSKVVGVVRGVDGTVAGAHAASILVYTGPTSGITGAGPFWMSDPSSGACTYGAEQYSLRINVQNGRIWSCLSGVWLNAVDAFVWVPPTACNSSVSGNGTGTNGFTALGTAPSIPVVQAQTSATGTNTHYFMCVIPPPSRLSNSRASYVVDTQFYYGVQTTAVGTQASVLASGTMNAKIVYGYIDYPAPAASETATGLAELTRADAGSLTITPAVASFNTATTTAGEFYSVAFVPATPIPVATNRRQLLLTVSLLNTATSATITNSPGFLVHYQTLQAGF